MTVPKSHWVHVIFFFKKSLYTYPKETLVSTPYNPPLTENTYLIHFYLEPRTPDYDSTDIDFEPKILKFQRDNLAL